MKSNRWSAYYRLMRFDRPIGIYLLLWPTLWALWLAADGPPPLSVLSVFVVGVILMRAAGCVINDYADRNFDGHVERTRQRPLPQGEIRPGEAKWLFVLLLSLAFCLVLTQNRLTIGLSLIAALLAALYPFTKRVTHLPQLVLGIAYSCSIPMAFAAVIDSLPPACWLLFIINILWTVAYDTQYAMVDRDDDLKIGIKSTAILFGIHDRLIIGLLQAAVIILLGWLGTLLQLNGLFYLALCSATLLFIYQQVLIAERQPDRCFRAFLNNHYVGMLLAIGILLGKLI